MRVVRVKHTHTPTKSNAGLIMDAQLHRGWQAGMKYIEEGKWTETQKHIKTAEHTQTNERQ